MSGFAYATEAAVLTLLTLLSISCTAPEQPYQEPLELRVEAVGRDRPGEQLTIGQQGATALVDVVSAAGIGRARLSSPGGAWPARILVRLHLQALEGFEAWNGSRRFTYAVPHEENLQRHRRQQEGLAIPPIDIVLPAELLQGDPAWVQIQWVDWYRG